MIPNGPSIFGNVAPIFQIWELVRSCLPSQFKHGINWNVSSRLHSIINSASALQGTEKRMFVVPSPRETLDHSFIPNHALRGWTLLLLSTFYLIASIYAIVLSKVLPTFDNPVRISNCYNVDYGI
jgi:hypothetical protein